MLLLRPGIDPIPPDAASLLYTTCTDVDERRHVDQEMFCHTSCLLRCLHPSVQLYAVDLLKARMVDSSLTTMTGKRSAGQNSRCHQGRPVSGDTETRK